MKERKILFTKILPDLYKIEVPLPRNPLRALNSYVIKGPARNLVIDTGMNREECAVVMFSALKELAVDLQKTDFFITHMHADHAGLVAALAGDEAKVYCSRQDAEVILNFDAWEDVLAGAGDHGFPREELRTALQKHPGYKYSPRGPINFSTVKDGDVIAVGDYNFRCVATPGHTGGHMCLYDPDKKILVSGDHVLDDITPNISMFTSQEGNPLQDYLASLDKVCRLEIEVTLPGHRNIIKNLRQRVDQLKQHHVERADEILSILEKGGADGYTVASQMRWDIDCPTWEQFPTPQKWFATGEAIAHLRYLEGEGRVKRERKGDVYVFSISR
jgi:glyoxylase-like metal-dependent hydrolase (beta-lactamase superfamily II)